MGLDKRAGEPLNKMHTWDVTFPQQTPNTTLAFVHIAPSTTIVYNLAGSDIYTYATMPSKNKYSMEASRCKSHSCRCIATIRRMALASAAHSDASTRGASSSLNEKALYLAHEIPYSICKSKCETTQ